MLTFVKQLDIRNGRRYNLYRCYCGVEKEMKENLVKTGKTKTCGGHQSELTTKHGHSAKGYRSPTYISWAGMKQRCLNPKTERYPIYGGRGITIHPPWLRFDNFLADMGERPIGKSIDRINVNGNYEPTNCKWSDTLEQRHNRRR